MRPWGELVPASRLQFVAMPDCCAVPFDALRLSIGQRRGEGFTAVNDGIDTAAQDDPEWVVWRSQIEDAVAGPFPIRCCKSPPIG